LTIANCKLQIEKKDNTSGSRPRVGILAGWGRYPIVVAEALRRQGYEIFCQAVPGHADPRLAELCDHFRWLGLARFGSAIRYFKRHGVTEATMVGKIHKVALFQPWRWFRLLPDLRTMRMFIPHFLTRRKDCRDDTLLGAIVNEFAGEGIRLGPATDYAPELLVRPGQLSSRGPSQWQWKDVEFGWRMAKEMGRLDIGQSVAVKDQAVLAVEAIEGTDQCIRRAGALCRAGGFTVVKVAKPRQDMRFDVPTIGLGTVQSLLEAGGRVLAVEAGKTIILDEAEVVEFANRHKLILVAMENPTTITSSDQLPSTLG
jgi:UDP-2,3-diacylglucosamine hydrolase